MGCHKHRLEESGFYLLENFAQIAALGFFCPRAIWGLQGKVASQGTYLFKHDCLPLTTPVKGVSVDLLSQHLPQLTKRVRAGALHLSQAPQNTQAFCSFPSSGSRKAGSAVAWVALRGFVKSLWPSTSSQLPLRP